MPDKQGSLDLLGAIASLANSVDRLGADVRQLRERLDSWDTTYTTAGSDRAPARTIHSLRMTATIFDQTRR